MLKNIRRKLDQSEPLEQFSAHTWGSVRFRFLIDQKTRLFSTSVGTAAVTTRNSAVYTVSSLTKVTPTSSRQWPADVMSSDRNSTLEISCQVYLSLMHTLPSKCNCCISWSLLPIPINACTWPESGLPSSSSKSFCLYFQPGPCKYMHGGGQKKL